MIEVDRENISRYLLSDPNKYLIQFRGHFSDENGMKYHAVGVYWWYSQRYKKWLCVPDDYPSDGATQVPDLRSNAHWFHDVACDNGTWECGEKMCNRQASFVLYDIMMEEAIYFKSRKQIKRNVARKLAAIFGWVGTFIGGGGKAKQNGWFCVR